MLSATERLLEKLQEKCKHVNAGRFKLSKARGVRSGSEVSPFYRPSLDGAKCSPDKQQFC